MNQILDQTSRRGQRTVSMCHSSGSSESIHHKLSSITVAVSSTRRRPSAVISWCLIKTRSSCSPALLRGRLLRSMPLGSSATYKVTNQSTWKLLTAVVCASRNVEPPSVASVLLFIKDKWLPPSALGPVNKTLASCEPLSTSHDGSCSCGGADLHTSRMQRCWESGWLYSPPADSFPLSPVPQRHPSRL